MSLLRRPPNCQQAMTKFVASLFGRFGIVSLRAQARVVLLWNSPLNRLYLVNSANIGGWGEGTPLKFHIYQNTSTFFCKQKVGSMLRTPACWGRVMKKQILEKQLEENEEMKKF